MRLCCFAFLCFGDKEEDSVAACGLCYFYRRNKGGCHMMEGLSGKAIEDMDNDDSESGFWANFHNDGGGGGLGLQVDGERANAMETDEMFDLDGESGERSEDFLLRLNDGKARQADGASGSQELKVDVNLNLGLGGESSSSTAMYAMRRDSSDRDSQNKRPKVHSFSL